MLLEQVESVEALSRHHVRYTLKPSVSATLPLMIAELPVLPRHYWENREFAKTTLEPPLLSGPYRITTVKPGSRITYERVRDYWGRDLPVNRGHYNFDTVTLEFYRDRRVAFEAFRSGQLDAFVEAEAKNWATGYDFSAFHTGNLKKLEVPYTLPGTRRFFAFNTRRPLFTDRRVRQAISQLFDWEWSRAVLFHNAYERSSSYFPLPEFSATGMMTEPEKKLLEPFSRQLPGDLFLKEFSFNTSPIAGDIRNQRRDALALLKSAGWHYDKGVLRNEQQQPFQFEFLHNSRTIERFILPYARNLQSVGIEMVFRPVDMSQYQRRLRQHEFDMVQTSIPIMPFPDERLLNLFHSESSDRQGSLNLAGICDPVVDQLVEGIVSSTDREQLANHVRALNRVLLWQHYTMPNWHSPVIRIAYWKHLHHPQILPGQGFRLSNWWKTTPASPIDTTKEE